MKSYDILVIGSGAGNKIARPAAKLGYKVALIERDRPGGTCLNRGCIPSKMLIHPADVATAISEAEKFNLHVEGTVRPDFSALAERVAQTIDKESDGMPPLFEKTHNLDYYPHEARFVSDKVVEVNEERLTADKIFIPVGARAAVPPIPGLTDTPFMTYYDALRCKQQPKKMIVIGAGYIAVELGYFFGALGTEMEFLVRSRMVRKEDDEIAAAFQESFSKRFGVHVGVMPSEVKYADGTFTVICSAPDWKNCEFTGDALLVATGVQPNTDQLGLENTAVELDERGYVRVDDHLGTTIPGVYAFGDVIGRHLFRHTANFEGDYLFRTLFEAPSSEPIQYPPIPHAIFSHPQIGSIGKREQDLKAEGIDYVVGLNRYADSAMGMALRSEEGFVKLLFERRSRRLVGAHIIGEEASNMIHMMIAYMKMGATLEDMLETIYVHPALPEVVRNAARKAKAAFDRPPEPSVNIESGDLEG